MKSNELLFELIHSLTKAEKRFIKLNAKFHKGDKIYLSLFDAIAKQKKYSEAELTKVVSGHDLSNKFNVAKNYLQNFIIKQLRQYHSGLKTSIECKNFIIDIEILYLKGQYLLAQKLVNKTRKIASIHEMFLVIEELNFWDERISIAMESLGKGSAPQTKNPRKNINKYLNILDYDDLIKETRALIRKSNIARNDLDLKEYEEILNNPLLKDINNALSFEAKFSFHILKSVLLRVLGDSESSVLHRELLIEHVENHSETTKENPLKYATALHNLLMHSLHTNDFKLYEEYILKLRNLKLKMPHNQAQVLSSLSLLELGFYTEHKEYEKAILFIKSVQTKFDELNKLIKFENELLLHYHASLSYFHNGDYKKSLKWVNNIINSTSKEVRVEVKASVYTLNILIHLELNNHELLPYLVKTTSNFFKTNGMSNDLDLAFISIFKEIPEQSNPRQLKKYLQEKEFELKSIKDQSSIIPDINYDEWLERKIQGLP